MLAFLLYIIIMCIVVLFVVAFYTFGERKDIKFTNGGCEFVTLMHTLTPIKPTTNIDGGSYNAQKLAGNVAVNLA